VRVCIYVLANGSNPCLSHIVQCIHFSALRGPSSSSGPMDHAIVLGLPAVTWSTWSNSKLLIDYSAFHGQVGGRVIVGWWDWIQTGGESEICQHSQVVKASAFHLLPQWLPGTHWCYSWPWVCCFLLSPFNSWVEWNNVSKASCSRKQHHHSGHTGNWTYVC